MFPAPSLLFFTTASGAGYGLIVLTLGADASGLLPREPLLLLCGVGAGLVLATAGLVASLAHLGRPERAWRAFSQWRSSWLSREGVLAVAVYGPALAYPGYRLVHGAPGDPVLAGLGGLAMALALGTVFCTGMIYGSLKAVHAWHTPLVPCVYLAFALASGAVLLVLLSCILDGPVGAAAAAAWATLALAAAAKAAYWRRQARAAEPGTPESATGLGGLGRVREWESPDDRHGYILREMGYRIARKRARHLKTIAALACFAAPAALTAGALVLPAPLAILPAALSALSLGAGLAVERRLFFTEARHAATLYYGYGDRPRGA